MSEEVKKQVKKIEVKEYIDATQLRKDLNYSTADISSAMQEQASLFAYYGLLAAKASMQVDVMKMLLENTEAEVSRILRDDKALKGEKTTEAIITALVTRHGKVIAARRALNEAKQIEAVGKIAIESMRHRRDMLVQQGLISREEMKGELSVALRNAKEEESRASQDRLAARHRARSEGTSEE